jgi:CheY-like chemotaxis protein
VSKNSELISNVRFWTLCSEQLVRTIVGLPGMHQGQRAMADMSISGAWVVLLVEDDILVRYSMAEALRSDGFLVLEASSGEDALTLVDGRHSIDVLLTDVQLAGTLTGWDVADKCRSARADLPVIYTSGNAIERTRQVAGSRFFAKPYEIGAVVGACRGFAEAIKT